MNLKTSHSNNLKVISENVSLFTLDSLENVNVGDWLLDDDDYRFAP